MKSAGINLRKLFKNNLAKKNYALKERWSLRFLNAVSVIAHHNLDFFSIQKKFFQEIGYDFMWSNELMQIRHLQYLNIQF